MIFNDLREFIAEAEKIDRFKLVEGADWNMEIGLITEWQSARPDTPLLIFDKIKGYPEGYRVATNLFSTAKRIALALAFSLESSKMDIVRAWRDRIKEGLTPIPPVEVETGPVKENIHVGDEVDLFRFPTPKWHNLDGGRYIGTGDAVIIRDPDEGWVNLGTYRVQIHDKSIATIMIRPGHHGYIARNKYFARGQNCPAVVVTGLEPVLWSASLADVPIGISEYDYAGGLRKKPVEVTKGITTDLPIPATAEIALEGEILRDETRMEGPFGEWTGYYAGGSRNEFVFKVNSILHRNNPILQGAAPLRDPYSYTLGHHLRRAAATWVELDRQIPGVKGVWLLDDAAWNMIAVVSIEQMFPGHAKQAALGVGFAYPSAYMNRFIIVVDDDIDPSNMTDVLWAMATRCEPADDIDIVRGMWGSRLDPRLIPEKKERGDFTHSTAIINACRPYDWRKEFPAPIASSPQTLEGIKKKWGNMFD